MRCFCACRYGTFADVGLVGKLKRILFFSFFDLFLNEFISYY